MANSRLYPSSPRVKRSLRKKQLRQPRGRNSSVPKNPGRELSTSGAKTKPSGLPQGRLLLVWLVLFSGLLGLGWRLYQLQIVQGSELKEKAQRQQLMNLRPYIPRRSIVDSQGNVLATDRLVYTLYVHPKLFKISQEEIAAKLVPILEDRTSQGLVERFKQRESGIRLAVGLTEATAAKIKDLSLDGLELIQQYSRFYPQQEVAAEVIGYVDLDRQGQAGLEYSQRKLLERELATFNIRRSGNGTIMPAYLPEGLLKSDDLQLQLTLDLRLQRAAREALKQQIKKFNAKRGTVIVMDARDGALVTLVSEPTYDPNRYFDYDVELFKNWAVTDTYEPGSTFKPINVAIALNAGVIQPNSYVYDSGSVTVDGWDIFNASKTGYGSISIAKVLQNSSNVGMIQIMKKLSKQDYYQKLKDIGLGKKVGVDLPGDAPGYLKTKQVFTARSIEVATTSFGQGFSLTPVKLAQLHSAIANGGKLVTPHVVQGLVDSQGHFHWEPPLEGKPIFSPETAASVLKMMETVVSQGTGKPAQIEGYLIGGKTGTAQKASPNGGYYSNAKITSFVSILPVDSPRYVVLAVVDEPQGGNTFGSTVAAPVVKQVMEALISIKGIPPSVK